MTLSSPESNQPTSESKLPVAYEEFIAEHPAVLDVHEKVYGILDARIDYSKDQFGGRRYDEWPKQSNINGYLGAGYEKSAYLVDDEYVVKIQNKVYGSDSEFVTDPSTQILALEKGVGIEGLEQLITADPESGIIVTEFAKGTPITEIPSKDLIGKILKEHISKLEKTLRYMTDNLLEFDNPHNVLFDPEEGFTIIDFRTPLGLKPDGQYSADIEDENYSASYSAFALRHTITSALDELLTTEKKQHTGVFDTKGEHEHYQKKTLGRYVVRSLVKQAVH